MDGNTVSGVSNDQEPDDPGQFAGIEVLEQSSRNRITNNVVDFNQAPGIAIGLPISTSTGPSDANTVSGNTSRNNTGGAASDGIIIGTRATRTVVDHNNANRNGDDGIDVEIASTTLTANTANTNVDLGIEAVAGVTNGGGNHASGNGNVFTQCLNITCAP